IEGIQGVRQMNIPSIRPLSRTPPFQALHIFVGLFRLYSSHAYFILITHVCQPGIPNYFQSFVGMNRRMSAKIAAAKMKAGKRFAHPKMKRSTVSRGAFAILAALPPLRGSVAFLDLPAGADEA